MDKEEIIRTQKMFVRGQIIFILMLVALFFVYLYLRIPKSNVPVIENSHLSVSDVADEDLYINPAISANLGKYYIINFKPLETDFSNIQSKYSQKTYIYFSYLNNSVWLGSNETKLFAAASMVKVPLAMAVLKAVENGQLSLTQSYTLEQLNLDNRFGDLYKVGAGDTLTIGQLLQIMLVYSDNTAMNALYTAMKLIGVNDPFADVYDSMGWQYNTAGKIPSYNDIDLKTLSNMFISLYNASYDNSTDSDLILKYLDESSFDDAIVAGIPGGASNQVMISHKIGVDDPDLIYSDCGIVYVPERNYLLCVGSVGATQPVANSFMSDISKAAYDYVTNN